MEQLATATEFSFYDSLMFIPSWLWHHVDGWALLVAVMTPALIIFGRQEIRLRRVRHIFDFERTFGHIGTSDDSKKINPSFEFVRSKYLSDVDMEGAFNLPDYQNPNAQQVQEILDRIKRLGRRRDFRMLLSSVALMIVLYFGVDALLAAITCGFGGVACSCALTHFAPCETAAGANGSSGVAYGKLVTIGALAFAGAFVETFRTFLRHLAVFDLSAYTFLRQTGEMVAAIIFTMIAFAAFPDPLKPLTGGTQSSEITWLWIALAPMLGLMPRSATQFVFTKTKNLIPWFKTEDNRYQDITRVTTVDVIDGIDFPTRFRLEICGIYDVQNLATTNPIMLHIESPFGIYQCIDWVAQAQLCHILGIEKFLMMRELNIRTIFDLERAIDSKDGPNEVDTIFAGILFAATDNLRKAAAIGGNQPLIIANGEVTPSSVDKYCAWARTEIGLDPARAKVSVEHLMRWIGDDLHVRRLRLIWNDICLTLGERAEALPDTQSHRGSGKTPDTST